MAGLVLSSRRTPFGLAPDGRGSGRDGRLALRRFAPGRPTNDGPRTNHQLGLRACRSEGSGSIHQGQLIGALAQLGEHLLCKQRVIGSIPIGSTIPLFGRNVGLVLSSRRTPFGLAPDGAR